MTVGEFFHVYESTPHPGVNASVAYGRVCDFRRLFLPLWENRELIEIGPEEIREALAALHARYPNEHTFNGSKGCLFSFFQMAVDQKLIPVNPVVVERETRERPDPLKRKLIGTNVGPLASLSPASPLRALFESYYQACLSNKPDGSKDIARRLFYGKVEKIIGQISIGEMTPDMYQRLIHSLRQTESANDVSGAARLLCNMFDFAVMHFVIPVNVCEKVPYQIGPYTPKYIFSDAEMRRIFCAIDDSPLRNLYGLEILTGLRPGELLGLTFDKILEDGAQLRIDQHLTGRNKIQRCMAHYGIPRTIFIPATAQSFLQAQLEKCSLWERQQHWSSPQGLIFADPKHNDALNGFVRAENERIRKAAALPVFSLQLLRENYLIQALRSGMSQSALVKHLGYTSPYQLMRVYYGTVDEIENNLASVTDSYYRGIGGNSLC